MVVKSKPESRVQGRQAGKRPWVSARRVLACSVVCGRKYIAYGALRLRTVLYAYWAAS